MSNIENNCGKSNKFIPRCIRIINCESFKKCFHVNCCDVNHKTFDSFIQTNEQWYCTNCTNCNLVSNEMYFIMLISVNILLSNLFTLIHTFVHETLNVVNVVRICLII